jgi:hypothetical protein
VQPGVTNEHGKVANCGWLVTPGKPRTVPLTGTLFAFGWTVRLSYIASQDGELTIEAGDTTQTVPVRAGLHAWFLGVTGRPGDVRLSTTTPALSVCTDEIIVGVPKAWPLSGPSGSGS